MLIMVTNITERAVKRARRTSQISDAESDELYSAVLDHLLEHAGRTPAFAPNMPREIDLSRRARFRVMDWFRKRARHARKTVIVQMPQESLQSAVQFDHRAFRAMLRSVLTYRERRYFWRHYERFHLRGLEPGVRGPKTRTRIIAKLRMYMRLNGLTPDDYYNRETTTTDTGTI